MPKALYVSPKTWYVRIDDENRPLVEKIARSEERQLAQVVRRLVDAALATHPLTASDKVASRKR